MTHMLAMEVLLPGGLAMHGCVERKARFRELTGRLELALNELDRKAPRPAYISSVLSLTLESIGGRMVDGEGVASLCAADRHFLMLRLAAMLSGERQWLEVKCAHCQTMFDVEFCRCDLPIKEAGPGFPLCRMRLKQDELEIRVPTGADQMGIAHMDESEAMRHLLLRCIRSVNGAPPTSDFITGLATEELEVIDQALDDLSPAVCGELLVSCPECKTEQAAGLDHARLPGLEGGTFYDEVHTLAMYYHWGESEILNMPRSRRRRYLALIDRSRAMSGQGE